MAKKGNKKWILILLLLLFVLGYCNKQEDIFGKGRVIYRTIEGKVVEFVQQDLAVRPHFADAEKNEIKDLSLEQSTVTWQRPGGEVCTDCTYTDVFFTYMDVAAYLIGPIDTEVRITNIEAYDQGGSLSGKKINTNLLEERWGCIKNDPVILSRTNDSGQAGSQYVWSPYDCFSDLAWVPTSVFEVNDITGANITQPILFRFTLTGNYSDYLGRSKTATRNAEIVLNFMPNGSLGEGFSAEVLYSKNQTASFIGECNVSAVAPCPDSEIADSACFGVNQVCLAGALSTGPNGESGYWPGCTWNMYASNSNGITFTGAPGSEGTTNNWWINCKDGKDNDCDGFADAGVDSSCPEKVAKFRTGANLLGSPQSDTEEAYINGNWIAVDAMPSSQIDYKLEIYKYFNTQSISQSCDTLCTNNIIARTPGASHRVTVDYSTTNPIIFRKSSANYDSGSSWIAYSTVPGDALTALGTIGGMPQTTSGNCFTNARKMQDGSYVKLLGTDMGCDSGRGDIILQNDNKICQSTGIGKCVLQYNPGVGAVGSANTLPSIQTPSLEIIGNKANSVKICIPAGDECRVLKFVEGSVNDCGIETACNSIATKYPFGNKEVPVDYPYTRFE